MIVESLILLMVFTCVYLMILVTLPRKTEQEVRKRLVPLLEGERRRNIFVKLLGLLAPINAVIKWQGIRQPIEQKLVTAGSAMNVNEYLAFKELSMLFSPVLIVLILGAKVSLPWLVAACALGLMIPDVWLRGRINKRHQIIARVLPEIIDLLELAVGAGLNFMIALGKVLERAQPSPLVEELHKVYQETKVGKPKAEALKSMARRINLPDVSSFVRTLVQAERMGTSMTEILRIQAEQARMWRFQRGERQALKAPIKLLLPLILFILPVVLIIVAGPILIQFMHGPSFGL